MKRILIVDDDEAIRESLAVALEETYQVLEARNGREALALLDREPVDAVLLDIMMPVLDGAGFLAEVRERGPEWARASLPSMATDGLPPVIVTSAGSDGARRAREMGARTFLAKPFDLGSLEAKLAEVIRSSGGGTRGGGGGGGAPQGRNGAGRTASRGT